MNIVVCSRHISLSFLSTKLCQEYPRPKQRCEIALNVTEKGGIIAFLSRLEVVCRPQLNEGLHQSQGVGRKLTLISAQAGFGKTTIVSEWLATSGSEMRAVWLSLAEGDKDPARFMVYLIAALQSPAPDIGNAVSGKLQSPSRQTRIW
jgi:hypothetical protein